jgi:uncharacterized protein (DUF885 family)
MLLILQLVTSSSAQSTVPGDTVFRAQASEFIEAELRLYPERATALGDHRYDNQLDDLSSDAFAQVVVKAKKWLKTFRGDDPKELSSAAEADREFLVAQADGELLWIEQLRTYEREPEIYLPTAAVNSLIKRDFAPLASRMNSVTAREIAALKNLDAARRNLKPALAPKVAIDITLQQMPGTLGFFRKDVPEAFAKVGDGADKRAFTKANDHLVAAIEEY